MKNYVVIDDVTKTFYEGFRDWNDAVRFAWARFDEVYNKPGLDYQDRLEDNLEYGISILNIEWDSGSIRVLEEAA